MVLHRKEKASQSLIDFLISNEKNFILNYEGEDEISNETNPKKQLYLYYILHHRILSKWSWSKWNFGIYDGDDYPTTNSVFNNNLIYQFYNVQWRYNVGYEPGTGIWLQDNYKKQKNSISELIKWANN